MAVRKTEGKLQWHLLLPECIEPVIEVLMMGAKKYSPSNWREEPYFTREQITDSMKRHQAAIEKGELIDKESGLLHSAHVACNALFQVYYDTKGLWSGDATDSPRFVKLCVGCTTENTCRASGRCSYDGDKL